jgi:hypothetical protein
MKASILFLSSAAEKPLHAGTRGILELGYDDSLKRIVTHTVASQDSGGMECLTVWAPELMTASTFSENAVVSVTWTPSIFTVGARLIVRVSSFIDKLKICGL